MKTKVSDKTAKGFINNVYNLDRLYEIVEYGDFSSVSDEELVYAIVGNERNFNEMAGREDMSIIDNLFRMVAFDLSQLPGIGKKKAVQIASMVELVKRKSIKKESRRRVLSSLALYEEFKHLQDLNHEQMWYMLIDNRGAIIEKKCLNTGTIADCSFDKTEVLKRAILKKASGIFLAHNHPSGNTTPSKQDDMITINFKEAANIMSIKLYDHIIIGRNYYYSYIDEGKL